MKFETYMEDISNGLTPFLLEEIVALREALSDKTKQQLEEESAFLFDIKPCSIVSPKRMSKDPHEYESFSIYSWPNPDTEDGMPYILRDGYVNYDHLKGDKLALRRMSFAVYQSGFMYLLTGKEAYLEFLKQHIRRFFLEEETRMNPSLAHAQAMPGVNDGQSGGIIDFGVSFGYSLSILIALDRMNALGRDIAEPLKEWLRQLSHWLKTHPNALRMKESLNNHSFVYDYLMLMISLMTRDEKEIGDIHERFLIRVERQTDEDGAMPLELSRPKSRSYYMMNLRLILSVAKFLSCERELQHERVRKIVEFYYPYGSGRKDWERMQVQYFYRFYDLSYMFMAARYFRLDATVYMSEAEKEESRFYYYLYGSVLNIQLMQAKEEEKKC